MDSLKILSIVYIFLNAFFKSSVLMVFPLHLLYCLKKKKKKAALLIQNIIYFFKLLFFFPYIFAQRN